MPLAGERVKASDLDFPITQARQTVAQSLPSGSYTALTFTTEDFDDDGMHSTSSNTSRFVAQRAGRYQVSGGVSFVANGTGRRGSRWAVNGTTQDASQVLGATVGSGVANVVARTMVVELAVGDYVELQAFQDSGGALNTSVSAETQPAVTIRYLGEG